MRHLRSILYALVLAPAVWILCGVGFDQDLTGRARDNGGIESLSGVLLLLLAGAAYAILLFSPISPAGPLLAGLALLGIGAWARIAPESYAGVWPANVAKDGFNLSTPGYGLAVLLAVPLVCTALSARRWAGFEPPQLVLIGTIGRARGAAPVAGTPMAAEPTTVIPQQRQAPGFPGVAGFPGPSAFREASGDTTDVGGSAQPTVTLPVGDDERTAVVPVGRPDDRGRADADDNGDEKAMVMQLGRGSAEGGDEPTQIVPPEPATEDLASDQASDETTRDVNRYESNSEGFAEETTRDVIEAQPAGAPPEDETTRLVLTAAEEQTRPTGPAADDGDERTQVIRLGMVEPPGDRTQLLTFPPPGAATTAAPPVGTWTSATGDPADEVTTRSMSIAEAERPDPGDDPTTRLSMVVDPKAAPARERRPFSATSLERPADEAADDTRPLTLPAPRPPAENA